MKFMKGLGTLGKWLIALCLGAMVLMTFINAVLRYVAHTNITEFEELSRYLFVWASFAGAIIAYVEGKHVGVDALTSHLKGFPKLVVQLLAEGLILVCCVVIGMGAVPYFMITFNRPAPATGISMGCLTVVGLLLTVALTVITIRDIVRIVKKYREEGNA